MIETATAIEFVRVATNGRTGPLLMTCETSSGENVELFCKFSAGCDQGVVNLAREAISVCLAADLDLPVPTPYFVQVPAELSSVVPDQPASARISSSNVIAFGSQRTAKQFSAWSSGSRISEKMLTTAAATLLFDGIIQNPDRRVGNPNCLVRGDELRLIDHELAFAHRLILGWRQPWTTGGMQHLAEIASQHIFIDGLAGREIDFTSITNRWTALSAQRLREYVASIPTEWAAARDDVNVAIELVSDARTNIDACVDEVRRILL